MTSNQPSPEEYTDGYVIFLGRRFIVDPRALIPRMETEELVKYCLKLLRENSTIQTVADIGTGSGIIPISIAEKMDRPLKILATDMSQDALDLARENSLQGHNKTDSVIPELGGVSRTISGIQENNLREASNTLGSNDDISFHLDSGSPVSLTSSMKTVVRNDGITFLQGDFLKPIIAHFGNSLPDEILLTANLPYVREKEINSGLIHEPRMAFLGGVQTGFELYERFFDQLLKWKNRPKICHVVIEFGLWQRDIAETVFMGKNCSYKFFSDLRGIERFAHIIL